MNCVYKFLWGILLYFYLSTTLLGQETASVLLEHTDRVYAVGGNTTYFITLDEGLEVSEVMRLHQQGQFIASGTEYLNFGDQNAIVWCAVTLDKKVGNDQQWLLEVGAEHAESIQLYYTDEKNAIYFEELGLSKPFSHRAMPLANMLFRLPGFQGEKTFFFRIKSDFLQFPVEVGTATAFLEKQHRKDLFYGAFYGILLFMAMYNMFLFFSTKEKIYAIYAVYCIVVGLFNAYLTGHGVEFLWPNNTWSATKGSILSALHGIFTLVMVLYFLEIKKHLPSVYKLFLICLAVFGLSMVIGLMGVKVVASTINQINSFFLMVLVIYVSIYAIVKGYRPAMLFLIGWITYMWSGMFFVFGTQGIITYTGFHDYILQVSFLVELIFLSLAFGYKLNLYKSSSDRAQLQLIQSIKEKKALVEQHNVHLQKEVAVQTEELRSANEELSMILDTVEQQKALIEKKSKSLTESINYAKRIQSAILPSQERLKEYLPEHFVLYLPKDTVSGDFYWVREVEGKVVVAVMDCTGHGIPGAFMSLIGNSLLREIVLQGKETRAAQIIYQLNRGVKEILSVQETGVLDGMDVSICVIDPQEGVLTFSGAKQALMYVEDGVLHVLKGNRFVVGSSNEANIPPLKSYRMSLDKERTYYLCSDGYADQFGEVTNKKYFQKRLREFFLLIHQDKMELQQKKLYDNFQNWKGNLAQLDDLLVMGFRYTRKKIQERE
ncbi:7TM diverse intracellular signaling domain-containing protein [Algivirga pacifica]|uniref:PPM-type phosphatase domain-containing protein n=1 Tax=Algivirga pacifica TaxID=1162670 RepID=A0ABP9D171_9BACT